MKLRPHRRRTLCTAALLTLAALPLVGRSTPVGAAGHMTYHHGAVIAAPTVYTIFWLPSGYHFDPQGDTGYESLINQALKDVGGTAYYQVLTQYSTTAKGKPVKGGPIQNQVLFGGTAIDTEPFPRAGMPADPLTTTDLRVEAARAMAANGWSRDLSHLFFIFLPAGVQACYTGAAAVLLQTSSCTFPLTGRELECTDRDWVDVGGPPLLLVPYSIEGCDPLTPDASPNHDPPADLAIRRIIWNLTEQVTDPLFQGWYAGTPASGEIADECGHALVTLNGHIYDLDKLWDNGTNQCVLAYTTPPPAPPPGKKHCKKGYHRVHGKCRKR